MPVDHFSGPVLSVSVLQELWQATLSSRCRHLLLLPRSGPPRGFYFQVHGLYFQVFELYFQIHGLYFQVLYLFFISTHRVPLRPRQSFHRVLSRFVQDNLGHAPFFG
jgi:hypothetical protein